MLSLFRAAAMEYKAPSALSFWEGEPHRFEYAIAPHGPDLAPIIREAHAFNSPVEPIRAAGPVAGAWALEPASVVLSGMRPHGEGVFLRLYEAMGRETEAIVALPDWVRAWAPADGSERRTGDWQTAEGQLRLPLRAYEIRGLLLRGE
jgi:alpha-mannosidase